MKKHALILCFDETSEQRVQDYWQQLGSNFVPRNMPPHVTIGGFSGIDLNQASETLQATAQEIAAFPMHFVSVGAFVAPAKVLYLAPTVTQELLALHAKLHERFSVCNSAEFPYYHPGNWVPHCTVANAKDAAQLAPRHGNSCAST
ncbi:MAG: 2'-5' RNA ligase family protein [Oscillospiraceae bacterium]|nr:2'-5' RNA ligase family protein [Oscillospiraceae bacterium]